MIYMNGKFAADGQIAVNPFSPGFLYGCGIYETVKVYRGSPIFLQEHLERLMRSLDVFGLECGVGYEEAAEICADLVAANSIATGFFKLICSRSANGGSDIIAYTGHKSYDGRYEDGFRLCLADAARNETSMLCRVKSLNHGDNVIELEKAEQAGYDEPVFLNTMGMVSEGSRSNIFWIKGGNVHTPSISCGLLPGVTRQKAIALCLEAGMPVFEGEYGLRDLDGADGVFLTSSLMGIMPVSKFRDRTYMIGRGSTAGYLSNLYDDRYLKNAPLNMAIPF